MPEAKDDLRFSIDIAPPSMPPSQQAALSIWSSQCEPLCRADGGDNVAPIDPKTAARRQVHDTAVVLTAVIWWKLAQEELG